MRGLRRKVYNGSMTGNSCCFVKTFPIVLFALFQIGCMNYRFKELSDNDYVVTLRQGDYLLDMDTRPEDNEQSYRTKIGDVRIKMTGSILTETGAERTCEWKQEVAELRQCNSETWTIQGYGLNVDSRKNGKVHLSFEGEIAEFIKGRRLRAWRFPW